MLRVFQAYVNQLSVEEREQRELKREKQASELNGILSALKILEDTVDKYEADFRIKRAQALLPTVTGSKIPNLVKFADDLYTQNFTTAAFQIGLFSTFFFMMEDLHGLHGDLRLTGDESEAEMFDGYLQDLNRFFTPQSDSEAKRLLSVFSGNVSGTFGASNMAVASANNLRSIVIPVELRPDEWPRFRYLFLELWRPQHQELSELVTKYRLESRKDVLQAFYRQKVKIYCKDRGIEESALPEAAEKKLKKEARTQYELALTEMLGQLPAGELEAIQIALEKPAPPTEEEIVPLAQTADDSDEE